MGLSEAPKYVTLWPHKNTRVPARARADLYFLVCALWAVGPQRGAERGFYFVLQKCLGIRYCYLLYIYYLCKADTSSAQAVHAGHNRALERARRSATYQALDDLRHELLAVSRRRNEPHSGKNKTNRRARHAPTCMQHHRRPHNSSNKNPHTVRARETNKGNNTLAVRNIGHHACCAALLPSPVGEPRPARLRAAIADSAMATGDRASS